MRFYSFNNIYSLFGGNQNSFEIGLERKGCSNLKITIVQIWSDLE